MKTRSEILLLTAVLLLSALVTGCATNASVSPHAGVQKNPKVDARAVLQKMAQTLAQAPDFSVTINSRYDAVQADGQRIEFSERRAIQLQRPDKLRVDITRSDGDIGMLLFDGKAITAYKANDNIYARVEKQGSVDQAVVYLVKDLQHPLPLARLLRTALPQDLETQINSIVYVEKDVLQNVASDHVAARLADVDLQVWITQGENPLPSRIVITYRNEPGQPEYRADFSDWQLASGIKPGVFMWSPPANAELIPFLIPTHNPGSSKPGATAGSSPATSKKGAAK